MLTLFCRISIGLESNTDVGGYRIMGWMSSGICEGPLGGSVAQKLACQQLVFSF